MCLSIAFILLVNILPLSGGLVGFSDPVFTAGVLHHGIDAPPAANEWRNRPFDDDQARKG
jgi:hypothetical protein